MPTHAASPVATEPEKLPLVRKPSPSASALQKAAHSLLWNGVSFEGGASAFRRRSSASASAFFLAAASTASASAIAFARSARIAAASSASEYLNASSGGTGRASPCSQAM